GDSVTRNIPPTLSFVPNVVHRSIFTLCIDAPVGRNGGPYCSYCLLLRSRNGARPFPSGPASQTLPDGVLFSSRIWPEVLFQQQRPVRSCLGELGTALPAAGGFSR